jgi:hypothetical protein
VPQRHARQRSRVVHGIGGGFCYEGDGKLDWQCGFFDFGHITVRCQKHITAGKMIEAMLKRLKNAGRNRSRRREPAPQVPDRPDPSATAVADSSLVT